MTDLVIKAENLGKMYTIGHQAETSHYVALRDVIMQNARTLWNKTKDLATGKAIIQGDTMEEVWALKDVSFEIHRGEAVGIIGRNGAGKSTLLKILSRITEPTTGRVTIKGRVASLLEVGTGFHPELTGRENIYLNGTILGMTRAEIKQKFDEIVAFAEVEKYLDTPVKRYSSGMYVRLAFAVAAHLEPEILLVDEVLAVGDLEFQKKCLGKMNEVAQGGRTVLFVSHNIGSVNTLCTQAIYLVSGAIQMSGTTREVTSSYLAEVVEGKEDDINLLRLPGYGIEVRFVDIRLVSDDSTNVYWGQDIRCYFKVFSKVSLKNLGIAGSIFTNAGFCVGTFFNKDYFDIEANQEHQLILTINNINLAPGDYYLGFSIGRGDQTTQRKDFDIVIGKPRFRIAPISQGDRHIAQWEAGWGNILIEETRLEVER